VVGDSSLCAPIASFRPLGDFSGCHSDCDKSAQGATEFCVIHGGGELCQHPDGCDKCAQRATDFCLKHGGGKCCVCSNRLLLAIESITTPEEVQQWSGPVTLNKQLLLYLLGVLYPSRTVSPGFSVTGALPAAHTGP